MAILAVWAFGFAGIALIRLRGWMRIRAAVRASSLLEITAPVEVRSSPGLLEPGVVGFLHPILLLPAGITERLTPRQLEAVLAHELCHVRRRDNLTSAMHMIVEAAFWFHPLVWWIGARLVEERERACDEGVLSLGSEPHVYAEAILNVCKLYVESPLTCVSGVTGADLKKRIEAIMINRAVFRLNVAKKVALALAGMVAVALPIVVGTMNAPVIKAQSPPPAAASTVVETPIPPPVAVEQRVAPKLIAQQVVPPKVALQAEPTPMFEVASIKLCAGGDSGGRGKNARGGGGPDGQGPSPDRLNINCQSLRNLIRMAYIMFPDGRRSARTPAPPIEGGPSWADSDRYQITAKAEGAPGQSVMRGPMLQALLEERFKLKIRRDTREVPVYSLTVAKNGPKLQPSKEGSCVVLDFSKPPALPGPGDIPPAFCNMRMLKTAKPILTWQVHGATLDEFSGELGADLDRIVINKTGITGKFDFQLEFAADETTAGINSMRSGGEPLVTPGTAADPSGGPSIFTAIQDQLGLKLESAKGPRGFLVIDRVEKPTEN